MKKTDFRRNLESIIISKIYSCDDVKLAEAAELMINCNECGIERYCTRLGLGCENAYYYAIQERKDGD